MQKTIRSLKILSVVKPKEQAEGEGARVCRYIGTEKIKNFDPFLMLDFFNVKLPSGFPDHPHRGFATMTYILSGQICHEDFKGHKGEIGPGDVQVMTAGKGIVHAEMPSSFTEPAIGFQLWLNLRQTEKYCDANYQEYQSDKIPVVEKAGAKIKVVVGSYENTISPIKGKTDFEFFDFQLLKNSQISIQTKRNWASFIVVYKGEVTLNEDQKLGEKHGIFFEINNESEGEMTVVTSEVDSGFIFVSGEPCKEPIFQYGPFVLTNKEELAKAFEDYQGAKNGFEGAREWSSKIKDMKYAKQSKN